MAVKRMDPPPEIREAFLKDITEFLGADSRIAQPIIEKSIDEALPVYTLTLEDILAQRLPSAAAPPAGWRLLIQEQGEVLASDVMNVPDEDETGRNAPRMTALSRDRRLAAVSRIRKRLEARGGGDYALKLMRIPGILVDAVWIASNSGDRIVPVLSAAEDLKTGQEYEAAEFFAIARRRAERFKAFDRRGRRPPSPPPAQLA